MHSRWRGRYGGIIVYISTAPNDAPQDVAATNVESRLIELVWSPPPADAHNGEIVHYIITHTELQTGRNTTSISFNTAVTLGNLHPFYDYIVIVAAFTIEIGPESNPVIVQTLEDGELKVCLSCIYILNFISFFSPKCPTN